MTIIGTALLALQVACWRGVFGVWSATVLMLVWAALVVLALLATWVFLHGAVGRTGDGHEAMVIALVLSWMGALSPFFAMVVLLFAMGGDLT